MNGSGCTGGAAHRCRSAASSTTRVARSASIGRPSVRCRGSAGRPRASAPRSTGGSSVGRSDRPSCSRSTRPRISRAKSSPASRARSSVCAKRSWGAGSPMSPRSTPNGRSSSGSRVHGRRADRRRLRRSGRSVGGRGLEDRSPPGRRRSARSAPARPLRPRVRRDLEQAHPKTSRSPTSTWRARDEVSHPMEDPDAVKARVDRGPCVRSTRERSTQPPGRSAPTATSGRSARRERRGWPRTPSDAATS